MVAMFIVEMVCSDPVCAVVIDEIGDPDALVHEVCDCGCVLVCVSVSSVELVEPRSALQRARTPPVAALPLAA